MESMAMNNDDNSFLSNTKDYIVTILVIFAIIALLFYILRKVKGSKGKRRGKYGPKSSYWNKSL